MAYLYQEISKVPGLSGSSYQKQKQLYERLGSPNGSYTGSTNQNLWLLGQIQRGNYGTQAQSAPAAQQAPTSSPDTNLAQSYADQAGAKNVYKGPVFGEVLPFQKAWAQMQPTVEAEANAQVNPFIQRQQKAQSSQFYNQLAGQGASRFGSAQGGIGTIQADMEKQRRAQIMDWMNQKQQGFTQLWYNPTEANYNKAIEIGKTPDAPKVPTWDEFASGNFNNAPSTSQPVGGNFLQQNGQQSPYSIQPYFS
jgi:hypothetical protein